MPKILSGTPHPIWPWYALCLFLIVASSLFSLKIVLPTKPVKGESKNPPWQPVTAERPAKPASSYRLREVAKWHIFGVPEQAEPEVVLEALPETELELKLLGAFTGSENYASAVIKAEQGDSQRIFIGDDIAPGVSLHSVQDAHVVIRRGEALESLSMFDSVDAHIPARPPAREESSRISPSKITLAQGSGFQNTPEAQLEVLRRLRQTASAIPGRLQ